MGPRRKPWEGLDNSTFNSSLLELVLEVFESEKKEEEDILKMSKISQERITDQEKEDKGQERKITVGHEREGAQ